RFVDPAFEPRCFIDMDHRANERLAQFGIARYQCLCSGDQHVTEAIVDLGMDNDALHTDTALPRLVEGAEDHALERVVQIRVSINDHCGIAAQFEYHLLLAATRLEVP